MNDVLTALLTAAMVFPLIGGLVSPWLGRRVVIGSLLFAGALAVAAAVLQGTGEAGWPTWGPVEWMTITEPWPKASDDGALGGSTFTIRPGLGFDPLAVAALVSLTCAGALILAADWGRGIRTSMFVAFAVVAAAAGLAATDVVQWLACGALLSLFVFATGESQHDAMTGVGTRRILVVHLAADGLLLSAVLLAWNIGGAVRADETFTPGLAAVSGSAEPSWPFAVDNLELAEGSTASKYLVNGSRLPEATGAERLAVFSLLGFALLGGLGGRCGAFPLFGWLHDAGRRCPTSSMLSLAIAVPCAALLLVRSQAVLTGAADVRLILAMGGAATAVVNGVITLAQDDGRVVLGYSVAALVGVAMIGLSTGGGGAAGATLLLVALPPVAGAFSLGLVEKSRPGGRRVLASAGFVLGFGLLGQGTIVAARLDGDATGGGLVTGMLFVAIALVSYGLTRSVLGVLRRSATDERTIVVASADGARPSPSTEVLGHAGVLFGVGLAFGLVPPCALVRSEMSGGEALGPLAGLGPAGLAAGVGAVAAWALAGRGTGDPGRVGEPLGPLVRLSRQRFYTDVLTQLFLSLPIRAFAQVCRFVDWFVLDGAVTGVPRTLLGGLDATGRPLRRGPVPVAVLTLLLVAAVLVWTLAW